MFSRSIKKPNPPAPPLEIFSMNDRPVDTATCLVGGAVAGAGITAFLTNAGLTVGAGVLSIGILPIVMTGAVVGLLVYSASQTGED